MSDTEHKNIENVQFSEEKQSNNEVVQPPKKKLHGCIIALIIFVVIAIIGFSICLATFSLDTK